ncbi:hypothetical protein C7S18_23890 (plasmid) [Ahniella affigens]|uniref:SMP-30/Gluconolactonase/LRE-like region domain-containing protein n=1 Tax=Ahniella affigens TaxID=2021234 RepID=A0A2P1PZS2_9GAMM|nr:hypothetical protein C7S18_23890 [Ahniella affigens]
MVVGTDLFVADQGNNRIQRLSLVNGAYQSEFGTGGAGLGQLSAPTGLAYNPGNGRIYVSELGNDRIQMFGLDGTPLATFGSPGSGDGQLDDPTALALDSFGNLYVADTNNNRIVAFSADGVFLRVVRSGVASPKGVAVDESDLIWTVSPTTSQLLAINRAGDTVVAYAASRHPGNHANNLREARGIAILNPRSPGYTKGRPLVMVADNDQSFIVGFQIGNAAREYRLIKTFQTTLTSAGQIALDRFDNLYVTSPLQARVHKYDSNGALIASWGSQGSAPGQFNTPYGIAVTTDDRVFVSDTLNHRVQQFDSVGTYQNQFGVQGAGIGELNMPMMLTARFGTFVVADSGNGRIVSWTPGSFFQPIGSQGSGDGELSQPAASSLDLRSGRTFISDSGNNRIVEFDGTDFLSNFGAGIVGTASLNNPRGIAVDQRGSVFVADSGNHRIVQFSAQGDFLSEFSTPANPEGVAIDAVGRVYVSFLNSGVVNVYGALRGGIDGIGVYRPSTKTFLLRRTATTGTPDLSFTVPDAEPGDLPVIGDWNGDGVDTPGLQRESVVYIWDRWDNISIANSVRQTGGVFGERYATADWNIDGLSDITSHESIIGETRFYDEIFATRAQYLYVFGSPAGEAVFGDWNSDGLITEARYVPTTGLFRFTNQLAQGSVSLDGTSAIGPANSRPLAGDWDGSGQDRVGVFDPVTKSFFLDSQSGIVQISLAPAQPGVVFSDSFEDFVPPAEAAQDIPISGRWPR